MSLDKFFGAIQKGTWHNIDELSNQLDISKVKLKELSIFLSDCGLIKYEENKNSIKIQPLWKLLLPTKEEHKLPKPNVAHFIISPKGSFDIQSTHISNMSNMEVEVTLRLDTKIKEIAIDV